MVAKFDYEDDARRGDQSCGEQQKIWAGQPVQHARAQQRRMHHQQSGKPAGREHHDSDEHQAEIELPDLRHVAEHDLQVGHQDSAEHRPDKMPDAADIGGKQHDAGLLHPDIARIDDLEVDGGEAARDAGKKARQAERDEAHHRRAVADELDAFGVFAHRIAHAPERRARERVHRDHADDAPGRDQIVDLDLRAEIYVEECGTGACGWS